MKCLDCEKEFQPEKDDLLPARRCQDCRVRLLLSFRNERSLYKRRCDLCGKDFIGVYAPDSPYTVYCSQCWWSDNWSPHKFGMAYDENRSFFDQFKELYSQVPHLGMSVTDSENSEYCNFVDKQKNCYLTVNASENESLFYCERAFNSKDSLECNGLTRCQLCYWNLSCRDCYHTCFSEFCENMIDCFFCSDSKSCQNCFGSFGLRSQKFVFLNEQLIEDEYKKRIDSLRLNTYDGVEKAKELVYQHWLKYPHRYANITLSEDVIGDNVTRSKHCSYIFDADEMENCKHCYVGLKSKEAQYCVPADAAEHCYNNMSLWKTYNIHCSHSCWWGSDIMYSYGCMYGQHLLGCVSLRHSQYCILNKRYEEDEYRRINGKIIDQLKKENIYGEYFPVSFSPFAYNETIAQEHYPLTKERAIKLGYNFKEEQVYSNKSGGCIVCGKLYKIIKQEKELYEKIGVPEPKKCSSCRYEERMKRRNPRRLYARQCAYAGCDKKLMSSFAQDRPEIIFCAEHYQKEYN